jgi:hypothetical protein
MHGIANSKAIYLYQESMLVASSREKVQRERHYGKIFSKPKVYGFDPKLFYNLQSCKPNKISA